MYTQITYFFVLCELNDDGVISARWDNGPSRFVRCCRYSVNIPTG